MKRPAPRAVFRLLPCLLLAALLPFLLGATENETPEMKLFRSPQAPKASDPKVEEALQAIEQALHRGIPPADAKSPFRHANPAISAASTYSGLSGNVTTLIMLGQTEGTGVLGTAYKAFDHLGKAGTVYELLKNMNEGRGDLLFLNSAKYYLGNAIADAGAGWAMAAASVGIVEYAMTSLGERAIALSDMKWWDAYVNFQLTEHAGDQFWIDTFIKGGPNAVAAEADRFWTDCSEVRGEDFFKTNNPSHVLDYRNRFLRSYVVPWVTGWADAQRIIARRDAELALTQWQASLRQANVRILGKIENILADCSEDPGSIRFTVTVDANGAVLARKTVAAGSFEIEAIDLVRIPNGSVTVSVKPEGAEGISSSSGSSIYVTLGSPEAMRRGVKTRVNGITVIATLPVFRLGVSIRHTDSGQRVQNQELPVPALKSDRNRDYDTRLGGIRARYAAGEIPLYDGIETLRAEIYALRGWNGSVRDSYNQAENALRFNRDFRAKQLDAQNQSDAASSVRREADSRIAANREALRKIEEDANGIINRWESWISAEQESFRKRDQAIARRLEEIRDEARKQAQEYGQAQSELEQLLRDWQQAENNAHWASDSSREPTVPAQAVSEMEALAERTRQRLPQLLSALDTLSQKIGDTLQRLQEVQGEKTELLSLNYGRDVGESLAIEEMSYESNRSRTVKSVEEIVKRLDPEKRVERNRVAVKRHASTRNAGLSSAAETVVRFEKIKARLPSADHVKSVGDRYKQSQAKAQPYLKAMRAAAFEGKESVGALPQGIVAPDGTDGEFINSVIGLIEGMRTADPEVVGDLFEGDAKLSCALGELQKEMDATSSRWADFTPEQIQKIQPVLQLYGSLSTARAQSGLYTVGGSYTTLRLLKTLGNTPGERLQAIANLNRKITVELTQALATARSWPPLAEGAPLSEFQKRIQLVSKLFVDAASWYGKLPDFPSLENLKLRGELHRAIHASQVLPLYRRAAKLPTGLDSIKVNGTETMLDGSTVVIKASTLSPMEATQAAYYATIGFKPVGTLELVFPKDPALITEAILYRGQAFMDLKPMDYRYAVPIFADGTHTIMDLTTRHRSPTGQHSLIEGEKSLTLIILF